MSGELDSDCNSSESDFEVQAEVYNSEEESCEEESCEESDEERTLEKWRVGLDHPFKKDYEWAPGDDEIYKSSEESLRSDSEEEEVDDDACLCGNCPDQRMDGPRVCCSRFGLQNGDCINACPTLQHIFLHQGTMDTLSITVDRHRVRPEPQDKEEYNKLMRLTAYHLAKDQLQLRGQPRTKLPDCLYAWVHQLFPSPSGNYVGFIG